MINDRFGVGLVSLLCLAICFAPILGRCEGLTATPGELIVAFEYEDSTVLEIDNCTVTSVYSSLNDIFSEYELECARPLFQPNSLVRNVYLLRFPPDTDLETVAEEIGNLGIMRHVCSNPRIPEEIFDYIPGDYAMTQDWNGDGRNDQWTYYMMQVDRAWDITRGDSSIIVGVLDGGIDWGHRDLRRNLWINHDEDINDNGVFDNAPVAQGGDLDLTDNDGNGFVDDVVGWDFHCQNYYDPEHPDSVCPDPYNPQERYDGVHNPYTHGSQMASIISAVTDNAADSGMAGIAFKAKVMGVRCAASDAFMVDIFEGTQYAVDNGADFLNMSFTLPGPNPNKLEDIAAFALWQELLVRAYEEGIITVTSADDKDSSLAVATERYPNIWPEVICVAAVDPMKLKTVQYGQRLGSNYGGAIDICAPACASDDLRGIVTCGFQPQDDVQPPLYPGSIKPHTFPFTTIATSGACAEVVGTLALLKSFYPNATPSFLETELARGAMPLNPSEPLADSLGAGVVNPYRSLTQWGTISQNTTWSNAVYVSGDITLTNGATLTVDPGTTVYIMPDDNEKTGYDKTRVELHVKGGFLDVNGTAENPVRFIAWDESGEISDGDAWRFLFLWDTLSTGASFDYCTIKNAIYGIEDQVNITLNHCTIEDCARRGLVVAYAESVYVANTTIRNIGPTDHVYPIGLNVCAGGTVRIENSTIENVGYKAAQVTSGATLYAVSTQFLDSEKGLFIAPEDSAGVDAVISGCTFKDNYQVGIEIVGPSTGTTSITSCLVDSNTTTGVFCGIADNVTLTNNAIQHSYTGLLSYMTDVMVKRGSYIANNHDGIKFLGSSQAVVESTEVYANVVGVVAQSGANPDLGHESGGASAGTNIFYRNHPHHIENLNSSGTIMAEMNWWGGSEPSPSRFVGSVDYDPWLEGETPPDIHFEEIPGQVAPFAQERRELPARYSLSYNYPNPFNPVTTFRYAVPQPGGSVRIAIYNVAGQRVATLVNEQKAPGTYTAVWSGVSDGGVNVASGVYFVRMEAGSFTETRKVILLK
jgi:hypothetical protein